MDKIAKRFAIGTIAAAVAGFVAGILTAPKSGKETRDDIKRAAQAGLVEGEKQLKRLHTEMTTLLSEAQVQAAQLKGRAQKELQAAIERAQIAKEKAREILSALHEGTADDEELKKAIEEAKKAVAHLANYLKR